MTLAHNRHRAHKNHCRKSRVAQLNGQKGREAEGVPSSQTQKVLRHHEKDLWRREKVLRKCAEDLGRWQKALRQLKKSLGKSAEVRGNAAERLGRDEKVLVEFDEVLGQSSEVLLQSARERLHYAQAVGKMEEVLILFAQVLRRHDEDLGRLQKVLGKIAQARSQQQKVLGKSAEDLGKSSRVESKHPKERSIHAKAVFQPSTSEEVPVSPTKSVHRSVAILKLPRVVAQIITFAQGVVTALTNNPKFPSPSPALSIVTAAIAALAVAESLATTTRAKGSATTRNDKKAALVALLQTLRTYVQNVADADAENSANIIQSAGFAVRKTTVHKPRTFEVTQGTVSGTAKVICPTAGHRASYDWEYSIDGGKTWVALPSTLQAKTTITGLAPGSTVQVRFRAVTKTGVADWSQPMSLFMK